MVSLFQKTVHSGHFAVHYRLLILFLVFFHFQSSAQLSSGTEEKKIITGWNADTAGIRALCARARTIEAINPDSALWLSAMAETFSRQNNYYYGIGAALQRKAAVWTCRGEFEKALQVNNVAIYYFVQSVMRGEHKPVTHWTEGLVGVLSNSGNIHMTMGNFEKCMPLFYLALQLIQNTDNDHYTQAKVYNNIAAVYISMRQYDRAISYLQQACDIVKEQKQDPSLAVTYTNMAIAWQCKQDFAKSQEYARKALSAASLHNDIKLQYATLMMLGDIYEVQKKRISIWYFQQAIRYAGMLSTAEVCASLFKLGEAYDTFKEYEYGKKSLLAALYLADSISARMMRLNILEALYKHNHALQLYHEAFDYQYEYMLLKDSIRDEKNTEIINQLDARYKSSLKDRELERRQMLIVRQKSSIDRKNWMITGVSAGIAILLLLLWLRHRTYIFRQKEQQQKIAELRREKEIEILKAAAGAEEQERKRIARELHDGVTGTLSVVKMRFSTFNDTIQNRGMNETMLLLDNAISELRNTAHNLSPETILEDGLQNAVNFFCRTISQAGNMHIDVQYSGDINQLPASFQLAVFRIVQELMQNVIKHAHAKSVLLQLGLWQNLFSLTLEDDGIGFNTDDHEKRTGFGLRNISLRVQALHGEMNISSKEGNGTTIYIEFDTSQAVS